MDYQNESEEKFLSTYDSTKFDRPNTTVDVAIFTIFDESLHVLTIKRTNHPHKDSWALVGGYVDIHQDHDIKESNRISLY